MSIDIDARTSDPPLEHDEATRLDERIRRMADTAARNLDTLAELVAKAKAGQIHEPLDFPSWTAYLADRLKPITKAMDREELRFLVVELHEAGMSVRDISAATGVPRSTVGDQVSETGHVGSVTHGHDGKDYPRDTDVIDLGSKRQATEPDDESDSSGKHHNGGRRGKWEPDDYATRAKTYLDKINGDPELHTRIFGLIDQLLASIQPATESA